MMGKYSKVINYSFCYSEFSQLLGLNQLLAVKNAHLFLIRVENCDFLVND